MAEIKSEQLEKTLAEVNKVPEVKMCMPGTMSLDKADSIFRKIEAGYDGKGEAAKMSGDSFGSLEEMKSGLDKSYKEIKEDKPLNSPNLSKWFEKGGRVAVNEVDGKKVWTYIDAEKKSVDYVDGYPVFPPEAKHPVVPDINIGHFTGDRMTDKEIYLNKLEEELGLTEIPEGYILHHDTNNGNMQLIRADYHKEFTHSGGHSLFKEAEN